MVSFDLLALARSAIESHDARLVLADAIEESGWWDDRIRYAWSNNDDRAECLAMLTWPGPEGEHHARVIAEALATQTAVHEKGVGSR